MGGRRVAVVYDLGSATPLEIRTAAGRACEVEFVGDSTRPHVAAAADGIRRFAGFTDLAGLDAEGRLKAVEALAPDGVVTFSEYRLGETAEYAAALGLPGHSAETVALLTDKLAQRRTLAAVSPVGFAGAGDVDAALAATGLPAVLKPRRGAGSAGTVRVDTAEELRGALSELPVDDYLLEQLLTGDPAVAGAGWGDYVSVESVHTPAGSRQVCVTGKFPLDGFRETGMLLPSTLSEVDTDAVLALDAAATAALGLRHGLTHTEIKLTPGGPRIIEVNGRLGGYVPGILKQATGIDLVRVALQVALGLEPRLPEPRWAGVTYQRFLTPGEDGVLARVDGADELASLPGVQRVDLRARAGDRVDRRAGTQALLGVVHGIAPDHDTLARTTRRMTEVFRPIFEGSPR